MSLPNIRRIFIPDEGKSIFDMDLDSADLRIVVWESDCKEMKQMFAEKKKPYVEVAKEYYKDPTITKNHPKYGTFKSFCHACLTGEHEVLTSWGWVYMDTFDESVMDLMVWDQDTGEMRLETPKAWNVSRLAPGEVLHEVKGQSFSQVMTGGHRLPWIDHRGAKGVSEVVRLPRGARFPVTGKARGGYAELPHSDLVKIAYKVTHPSSAVEDLDPEFHTLGPWLLTLSEACQEALLANILSWGQSTYKTGKRFYTKTREAGEWIQTLAHIRGMSGQVTECTWASGPRGFQVSICGRQHTDSTSLTFKHIVPPAGTLVYCPTTSTGFFLVRHNGKVMITGNSNYLGQAKSIAGRVGLTVHETERTQAWYFSRFPEIKKWQDDLIAKINATGRVRNAWGYEYVTLDRITNATYREMVAWLPQSTVGILINHALVNIDRNLPDVELLIQVHDSLVGQYPTHLEELIVPQILQQASIPIPYADPLVIPVGLKTSSKSWGDCE